MKKITSVLIFTLIVTMAFAQQRTAIQMQKLVSTFNFSKGDTLFPPSFATGTPTYYITVESGTTDTGYVAGTNYYGDVAKVQEFTTDIPCSILGCVAWIATKTGTVGAVTFNVYNSNGNGTDSINGAITTAPGTVLGSVNQNLTDMVAGTWGANVYMLATAVNVTAAYYVGIDMTNMGPFPANKFGIVSTTNGDGGTMDLSWEKWSDGTWHSLLKAWPLDLDLGFFPIVDLGAGIQNAFVHNLIVNIYPNPATSNATVDYTLKNDANNVSFKVFDVTGKVVVDMGIGTQTAGNHTLSFDASQLSAGTYYYGIVAGKNNLIKPLVIQ